MRQLATLQLLGLAVAIGACHGTSSSGPGPVEPKDTTLFQPLVKALAGRRTIEPRLTGGFPHAVCTVPDDLARLLPEANCSPPLDPGSSQAFELSRAARRITGAEQSAGALHLSALLYLIQSHDALDVDRAINRLATGGAAARGYRPEVLGDLAAAYFQRAILDDSPADLIAALAHATSALAENPQLTEARFNLALILTRLSLRKEARDAWSSHLEIENDPRWSSEAHSHLQQLAGDAEPVSCADDLRSFLADVTGGESLLAEKRCLQEARILGERRLLPVWAQEKTDGRQDAARETTAKIRRIVRLLHRHGGGRLLGDSFDNVTRSEGTDAEGLLSEGLRVFRRGLDLYAERAVLEAAPLFDDSRRLLAEAGNPMAHWATFYSSVCAYHQQRYTAAYDRFVSLAKAAEKASYSDLQAHAFWMTALIDINTGRPGRGLDRFQMAREIFERLREDENSAAVGQRISFALNILGRDREAWPYRLRALRAGYAYGSFQRLHSAIDGSGKAAVDMGYPGAALHFRNELVRNARTWGNPEALAQALMRRSRNHYLLGDLENAGLDIENAGRAARVVPDPALRQRVEASISLVEADLALRLAPERAGRLVEEALHFFQQADLRLNLAFVRLLRARAHLAIRDLDLAETELSLALVEIETQRASILRSELRRSFLEQSNHLFEEMIEFQINDARDAFGALEAAERKKARALLEGMEPARRSDAGEREGQPPLDAHRWVEKIPASVQVVYYEVLPDRLVAWVAARQDLRMTTVAIGRKALYESIERMEGAAARGDDDGLDAALAELYATLIEPLESWLKGSGRLIVVADELLLQVPFAALLDKEAWRYLIESYEITLAPSASQLFAAGPAPLTPGGLPVALVIGNPTIDREVFPGLPNLPGAEAEARDVAGRYATDALIGDEATAARFLERIEHSDVVHFAGHAVVNTQAPAYSALSLAHDPSHGAPGVLYARDLAALELECAPIVVLSACRSAGGPWSKTEGIDSLARSFLGAGASAVIGSLWDIGDGISVELLTNLHEQLLAGAEPAQALRKAQLSFLGRAGEPQASPINWGAFQVNALSY